MAVAGLFGTAQATAPYVPTTQGNAQRDAKATPAKHTSRRQTIEELIGGVPLVSMLPDYGMSPKEYGIRYGNGASRKGKSNRLRNGHNAKVARRG